MNNTTLTLTPKTPNLSQNTNKHFSNTKNHMSNNTPQNHVLQVPVNDVLRVEMMVVYMLKVGRDEMFELYYMLVCCSDGGVVRNRKRSGEIIREKLGITRTKYDMMVHRLKGIGLLSVDRGMLRVYGAEYIDWDNKPKAIEFYKEGSK